MLFGTLAYRRYWLDIGNKEIQPNRWSWLVWSVTTMVEASTYFANNLDWLEAVPFFVSGFACVVVTITIWHKAKFEWPDPVEAVCVLAATAATILWLCFHLTWWAHVIVILAVPVAFWPTWQKAWHCPKNEQTPAWMLWTIGDALALVVVLMRMDSWSDWQELPYAVVELACHGAMWLIIKRCVAKKGAT